MCGRWPGGVDVVCSCGWESQIGGAVRSYVRGQLAGHRSGAQWAKDRGRTVRPGGEDPVMT